MSTGAVWLDLGPSSLLNLGDLTDNLRDRVMDDLVQARSDVYPEDGTLGSTRVTVTYNAGHYLIVGAGSGVDNAGHRLTSDGAAPWSNCPFPDTGAVAYSIGARYQIRPGSVTGNTADGAPVYDTLIEDVGELGAPDLVTDNGNGTVTLRVDSLVGAGWANPQTKPAIAYLVTPETASADAFYTGTVSATGGHYVLVVPHQFGQTGTPSTTAADYQVIVRGPKVSAIGLTSDYWVLGACNTGVVNTTVQTLLLSPGSFGTVFGLEHDNGSGKHTAINPVTVFVGGSAATKVAAKGFNGTDDTSFAKYVATDSGNNTQVEIWTDADAGGRIRFPLANMGTTAGARIDVRKVAAGTVNLWLTNDRGATDYCDLMIDGRIGWNPAKSGNTWGVDCNLGGNAVFHVNNLGAGNADIQIDKGDLSVPNGKATLGSTGVLLTGASAEVTYNTPRDRYLYIPAIFPTNLAGTPLINRTNNPPFVQDNAAGAISYWYALTVLGNSAEESGLILDVFSCYHARASATGSITAILYYADGQAGSAPVAVTTLTASDTTGNWVITGMNTSGIAHTWVRTRHYWIEVIINPNGDATLTNYKVHGFILKWKKAAIAG